MIQGGRRLIRMKVAVAPGGREGGGAGELEVEAENGRKGRVGGARVGLMSSGVGSWCGVESS